MGADKLRSFSPHYRPLALTVTELEQQLASEGKEVPIEQIAALPDGTLSYKDHRIIVYIRDVPVYGGEIREPRFHVAECATLREMRRTDRFGKYVVATRDDGLFRVILIEDKKRRPRDLSLRVCQNCLKRLEFDGFSFTLSKRQRKEIVSRFTIGRFFQRNPVSLVLARPQGTTDSAPINDYSPDFQIVSAQYKNGRNWICENCGRDFSAPSDQRYLHVHHRNGLKYDNAPSNLQALCIGCHSDQHQHMKRTKQYAEYRRSFS